MRGAVGLGLGGGHGSAAEDLETWLLWLMCEEKEKRGLDERGDGGSAMATCGGGEVEKR